MERSLFQAEPSTSDTFGLADGMVRVFITNRMANPQAHREAITSRSWFMSSVGRRTEHAGQTTITLTGMHSEFRNAGELLLRVSRLLQAWPKVVAAELDTKRVWILCCEHLKRSLAAVGPPRRPAEMAILTG